MNQGDLSLTMGPDGVVEVGLVEITDSLEKKVPVKR